MSCVITELNSEVSRLGSERAVFLQCLWPLLCALEREGMVGHRKAGLLFLLGFLSSSSSSLQSGANRASSVGCAKRCNSVLLVSPDDEEEEEEDQEEEQNSGPRVYIGEAPSITVIPMLVPQVLPEEQEGEEGMSDSDSEGPILYKDEDEDEEEDESHNSKALTLQLVFSFSAELLPGCVELGISEQLTQLRSSCSWFLVHHVSSPLPFQRLRQPNLYAHLTRCCPSGCRLLIPLQLQAACAVPPRQLEGHRTGMLAVAVVFRPSKLGAVVTGRARPRGSTAASGSFRCSQALQSSVPSHPSPSLQARWLTK